VSWSREAVYGALLTQLQTQGIAAGGIFQVIERKLRPLSQLDPPALPALYLFQPGSRALQSKRLPQRSVCIADLFVCVDEGSYQGNIKTDLLNAACDAVDTALKPDPLTKVQTLGGLVSHCWTEGEAPVDEEVLGPQCKAMIPVYIEVGQDNTGQAGSLVFDTGGLFVTPQTKGPGTTAADDMTPTELARLSDITITGEHEIVGVEDAQYLYKDFPMSKLRKIKGHASFAAFDGAVVDQVFFGAVRTAGCKLTDLHRKLTVPVSPPYTVTVSSPSSGTFADDLGVVYAADGTRLTLSSGLPVAGSYTRTGATYTFNAADAGTQMGVSYSYTLATGTSLPLSNDLPGRAPTFQAVLQAYYAGQQTTLVLYACVTHEFSVPVKTEQFAVMGFDFEAYANDSGQIGTWNEGPLTTHPHVPGEDEISVTAVPAALDEGHTYASGIVGVAFTVANVGASPTLVWGEHHYTTTGTRVSDTAITFTAPLAVDAGYAYGAAFKLYVRDVDGHDHPSANTTAFMAIV